MGKVKNQESTRWCFTINNPTGEDYDNLRMAFANCDEQKGFISAMVVGRELAPTTQTVHFQGYVEITNSLTLFELKEFAIFNRAHLEPSGGSREQNLVYCRKGSHSRESGFDIIS